MSNSLKHKAKLCTYCKHPYIKPCNGKDKKCGNKVHLEKKKKP